VGAAGSSTRRRPLASSFLPRTDTVRCAATDKMAFIQSIPSTQASIILAPIRVYCAGSVSSMRRIIAHVDGGENQLNKAVRAPRRAISGGDGANRTRTAPGVFLGVSVIFADRFGVSLVLSRKARFVSNKQRLLSNRVSCPRASLWSWLYQVLPRRLTSVLYLLATYCGTLPQ